MYRILLADDHEVVRRGLRAVLSVRPEWKICAEAINGREAIEHAKRLKPDLVIMDIGMPELNGLCATRQILRDLPRTEVLILTIHASEHVVWEVLDAGAHGFILKSDAGCELVAAVDSLLQHKLAFTNRVSEMILHGYLNGASTKAPRLTVREQEVVQLLAEGKSNKEVANVLNISIKTAESHRSHAIAKLNLRNSGELVLYAVRNGIVRSQS